MCIRDRKSKRAQEEVQVDEDAVIHTKVPRKECSATLGFLKYHESNKKLTPEDRLSYKTALEAVSPQLPMITLHQNKPICFQSYVDTCCRCMRPWTMPGSLPSLQTS